MATKFTIPSKQNVVFKYSDGSVDDLSLDILRVENALILNDILKDADMDFDIASLEGTTHNGAVSTWSSLVNNYTLENSGTGQAQYVETGGVNGGPSLYFADASDTFKSARKHLALHNNGVKGEYSTTGEFVFYVVFEYNALTDIDIQPTILSREGGSNQHYVFRPGKGVEIYGKQGAETLDFALSEYNKNSFAKSTPYVRVVRRDKDGDISVYDEASASMAAIPPTNKVGFDFGFSNIGAQDTLDNARNGGTQPPIGSGVMINRIGLFNSDIGAQKAQALGRLLSDKYITQTT